MPTASRRGSDCLPRLSRRKLQGALMGESGFGAMCGTETNATHGMVDRGQRRLSTVIPPAQVAME